MSSAPTDLPQSSSAAPGNLQASPTESFEFTSTHWIIVQVALFVIGIFICYKMLQIRKLESSWQKFWLVFWSLIFSPLAGALYLFVFVPVDKGLVRRKK
jgi:hypothetical protein